MSDFPTIIGHRGAAGLVAENTIPSFIHALELGCRIVELDVHCLPREGDALAVIHDAELDRTTNLQGHIENFSHDELLHATPPVPLLTEVLDAITTWLKRRGLSHQEILINIELKGKGTVAAVLATMTQFPSLAYVISSFAHNELYEFRQVDHLTRVAPLFSRWQKNCIEIAESLDATSINLSKHIVTANRVRKIRDAGFETWVYTVNSKAGARRMAQLGVSAIFTDRPDRMLS